MHPRVRVQHQTNRGVSAARNAGICASTARFVALLDVRRNFCRMLYNNTG